MSKDPHDGGGFRWNKRPEGMDRETWKEINHMRRAGVLLTDMELPPDGPRSLTRDEMAFMDAVLMRAVSVHARAANRLEALRRRFLAPWNHKRVGMQGLVGERSLMDIAKSSGIAYSRAGDIIRGTGRTVNIFEGCALARALMVHPNVFAYAYYSVRKQALAAHLANGERMRPTSRAVMDTIAAALDLPAEQVGKDMPNQLARGWAPDKTPPVQVEQ